MSCTDGGAVGHRPVARRTVMPLTRDEVAMAPMHEVGVVNEVVEKVVDVVDPVVVPGETVDVPVGVVPAGPEVVEGVPDNGDNGEGTR
jgi:hypothetical protein